MPRSGVTAGPQLHLKTPMSEIDSTNVVQTMLRSAFTRLDANASKSLDKGEFKAMYEMLLPGTAVDRNGKPKVSLDDAFARMDHNHDGQITQNEMDTTPVALPADVCDESLQHMIQYLLTKGTKSSVDAAALLSKDPIPAENKSA